MTAGALPDSSTTPAGQKLLVGVIIGISPGSFVLMSWSDKEAEASGWMGLEVLP
jgi:hypothetical protein